MQLRDYQNDAIKQIQHSFQTNKRTVLCLATGAGKTVVFSKMLHLAAIQGTPTLVLTHRAELFEQTFSAIERHCINVQRIDAKTKHLDSTALVSVAMVETIERRLKKGFELMPKLIIIDEAHFGNFTKLIEHFSDSYVIGATATPVGKHFYKYYTNLVEPILLSQLVERGYLCPYKGYQMQDDFSDVKKSRGEFDDAALFSHFDKPEIYAGVVEKYLEHCNGKKAIVFNCNIEHSEKTTQAFKDAGIESYSITSKTDPNERKAILKRYKRGEFLVINNCGVLTTGFDEPTIEVVIVNRATMSLPLWLQMCGRGSRTSNGKTMFTVLDFGKNHDRHGMWSEDRIWTLKPPKEKKGEKAPPVKECPQCAAMLMAQARLCEFCGYEYFSEDTETEFKDGVLVEVVKPSSVGKKLSQCTVAELLQLEILKLYSAKFIWRVLRARGRDALNEYAKKKHYNMGWVDRQLRSFERTFNDYTVKL
jgi:superfamily II DNA or RNA helicase